MPLPTYEEVVGTPAPHVGFKSDVLLGPTASGHHQQRQSDIGARSRGLSRQRSDTFYAPSTKSCRKVPTYVFRIIEFEVIKSIAHLRKCNFCKLWSLFYFCVLSTGSRGSCMRNSETCWTFSIRDIDEVTTARVEQRLGPIAQNVFFS